MKRKNSTHHMTLTKRKLAVGWSFILPAALLLVIFNFYPMFQAIWMSLQKGKGANVNWNGLGNYARILKDRTFRQSLFNTFFYLIIQVLCL